MHKARIRRADMDESPHLIDRRCFTQSHFVRITSRLFCHMFSKVVNASIERAL